jgi:hypothetical protein
MGRPVGSRNFPKTTPHPPGVAAPLNARGIAHTPGTLSPPPALLSALCRALVAVRAQRPWTVTAYLSYKAVRVDEGRMIAVECVE